MTSRENPGVAPLRPCKIGSQPHDYLAERWGSQPPKWAWDATLAKLYRAERFVREGNERGCYRVLFDLEEYFDNRAVWEWL
jgi:hypothetical protein